MEKLLRIYKDGEQDMQEFEVTTASGKKHIVRKPALVEAIEIEPQETLEEKVARLEEKIDQLINIKQTEIAK